MLNPDIKIAKSKGIDLPVLKVYLAGRIAGNCIEKCMAWRKQIIDHYKYYEIETELIETYNGEEVSEYFVSYPIVFLDPLNSKESDSVDQQGLKSRIPPGLIFDKDMLSIKHADVIVANMDDYMEEGLEWAMDIQDANENITYSDKYIVLRNAIKNRRANLGTIEEVGIAKYLGKPVILIVPPEQLEIYKNHPFQKRASVIVTSVEELLNEKWLEVLYKSIAGAIY